tara:strand:+ start:1293 stop:2138 length:846 start_codon:yes stop_codon:yes gene_type:complete
MSITSESLPYPTREISSDFPAFLSEIGANSVPIAISANDQTVSALKANTYHVIAGTGTGVTFDDPTSGIVNGNFFKVLIVADVVVTIGDVAFTNSSPIEILRIYSNDAWETISSIPSDTLSDGIDASQITSGTFDIARIPDIPLSKIINTDVTSLTGGANSLESLDINSADYGLDSIIVIVVDGVLLHYQAQTRSERVNDLPYLVRPNPAPTAPDPDLIWVHLPTFGAGDSDTSAFAHPTFTVTNQSTASTTFDASAATVDDIIEVLATLIKTLKTNNVIK